MTRNVAWLGLLLSALTLAGPAAAEAHKSAKPRAIATGRAPARAVRAAAVEVLWGGTWWPAEVVETREDLTKIHYTGWGPEWDEWVEAPRLRRAAPPLTSARVGQRVLVEWHGRWWDGEVIATKSGLYKVHYTGWGPEWDEWVETPRLRAAPTPERVQPRAFVPQPTGR